MSKLDATREVRKIMISGYEHYSRQQERADCERLLLQTNFENTKEVLENDIYLLADQPLRNIKNKLICMVTVFCRQAADLGADDRRCYALSDHYIRKIEDTLVVKNWAQFGVEIVQHYAALVAEGRQQNYSLPIGRAVRYIQQNLFRKFDVREIADAVGVHPNYLSSRFRKEVGLSLHDYIRNKKMEEAKSLLQNTSHSISEIAEMLGYCSVTYFAKVFRKEYGHAPSELYKQ